MQNLYDIQRVIMEQFHSRPFYKRSAFEHITLDNGISGILGSRGIGKTTYLLHQVASYNADEPGSALYVSADTAFFLSHSFLEVADYLYKETNTRLLCIDEIHKYPNWEQELKNMTDIYPSIKVLFTGSSMIDIIHSQYDLSRRVTLYHLAGLSFREYLAIHFGLLQGPIAFDTLLKEHIAIADQLDVPQILKAFRAYLSSGYYFFSQDFTVERERFQAIENISQKMIYEDIAVLHNLKTPSLRSIEQTYKYILNSPAGELNVNKLANLIQKSYDQTVEYLAWLEQAGLINQLYAHKSGKSAVKSPHKLFPENTNLMAAAYIPQLMDNIVGKQRETFLLNQCKHAKLNCFYPKTGDLLVNDRLIEVGGKNKTAQQVQHQKNAYVAADNILTGDQRKIPLYLFGFLY